MKDNINETNTNNTMNTNAELETEQTQVQTENENNTSTEKEVCESNQETVKEAIADAEDDGKKKKISKLDKFEKKAKNKKIIMTAVSVLLWTICVVFMYVCASNVYQNTINKEESVGFFGKGNAVMVSSSMEPIINVNDIILYKKTPLEEINVNDIVVYKKDTEEGRMLIVHKVQSLDNGYLIAKGEQNAVPDNAVPVTDIVGKYTGKIPKLGVIVQTLSKPKACVAIITSLITLFIIRMAWLILSKMGRLNKITKNKDSKKAIKYFFGDI